jgi:hypothetical protein
VIDPQWVLKLKGKDYVLYVGLLDAATKAGLKEVSVKLLQFPDKENGEMAIAEATVVFDDGRCFTEVGDCSPRSTTPQLAVSSCRLAATRAKGRAFRDALNVAAVMVEELPPDEAEAAPARPLARHEGKADTYRQERAARTTDSPGDAAASGYVAEPQFCADCGEAVPANVAAASEKRFGRILCIADGKTRVAAAKVEAQP